MKQQTAVEFLVKVFNSTIAPDYIPKDLIDQAKEIERGENIRFAIQKLKPYTYWNEEFADHVKEDILRLEQELANTQTYGGEGDAQIFFTKDDMRKAFQAGEVSKNRAILRDEGYDLNSYDLPNVDGFEDWIENYA